MITCVPESMHERDSRFGDGIHVRLWWRAHDDGVCVAVTDTRQHLDISVEARDRARTFDGFHHPFA
jgi:hypothetical protein